MPKATSRIQRNKGNVERLDARAFYLGAHGIDPTSTKEEIEAKFIQDTLEEKEEPLRQLHGLEARLQQVKKERPEAEEIWEKLREALGDTPPPYFHALSMAAFGLFALIVDVLVLAPSMDMIGVADPGLQYVVAIGFATLFTAWFELSGLWYQRVTDTIRKCAALAAGGAGALTLLVWGLLRGRQLQFLSDADGKSIGGFLGAHPVLSAIFFILITLATPMVGAFTFLWAWHDFSVAKRWRHGREQFTALRQEELELPRKIEAESEQLTNFERRKEAEAREWKEIFDQYYDRGKKNGARRESLWSVIWKSALGALGGTILVAVIPPLSLLEDLLLPLIPGLGLFIFFNYRRLHPTPEQYLSRENTKFAVIPDLPVRQEIPLAPIHLLSKGDEE